MPVATYRLRLPRSPLFASGQAQPIIQQEIARAVFVLVNDIATTARERAPVDRGILRASLFAKVDIGAGGSVTGVVATGKEAPYAADVELGRGPHVVPIGPLRDWARRKLGNERAAYPIQRAIAQHGTRAQPFFRPAIEAVEPRVRGALHAAALRIARRLQGGV